MVIIYSNFEITPFRHPSDRVCLLILLLPGILLPEIMGTTCMTAFTHTVGPGGGYIPGAVIGCVPHIRTQLFAHAKNAGAKNCAAWICHM